MSKISAEIKKNYDKVIVLDEQGVRRLYSEIYKQMDGENNDYIINLKIEYSDNSSIETLELEYIAKEENINGKEIIGINFEGKSKNKTILVSFGNYHIYRNKYEGASLKIVGPDQQWIYLTKSIIEDRIKSFSKSIPRKGTIFIVIFLIMMFIAYLSIPYLCFLLSIESLFKENQQGARELSNTGFVIIIGSVFISAILSLLIAKLFPNVTFLIGKGIERYNSKLKIRTNLFWVVVVGLFVSILAKIIEI